MNMTDSLMNQKNNLCEKFLNAVKDQNIDVVNECIGQNVSFSPDWAGYTALHYASINGNYPIAKLLLQSGLHASSTTKFHKTPLHFACEHGHQNIVELLLAMANNSTKLLEAVDILDMTPLHWTCERGHVELIKYLCGSFKFNFNLRDKFNRTVNEILKIRLNKCLEDFLVVIKVNNSGDRSTSVSEKSVETRFTIKSFTKSVKTSLIRKNKCKQVNVVAVQQPCTSSSVMDQQINSLNQIARFSDFDDEMNSDGGFSWPSQSLNSFMDDTLHLLQNHIQDNQWTSMTTTTNYILDELKAGRELILTEAGKLTLERWDDNDATKSLMSKVRKSYERQAAQNLNDKNEQESGDEEVAASKKSKL